MRSTESAFVTLFAIAAPVVAYFAIGLWILRPLDAAVREIPIAERGRTRFSIVDFLCLFILVQLPFSVLGAGSNRDVNAGAICLLLLLLSLGTTIWATGVIALCRSYISSPRQHFIILGLILPLVYYGLLPFCLLLAAQITGTQLNVISSLTAWLILGGLGVLFLACGFYVRRVTRAPRTIGPNRDIP